MTDLGPEQQALVTALQSEYAAIFAYGVVAAYSNANRAELVAASTAAHRARRDETLDELTAASVNPPEAEAGYASPVDVVDAVSAARLAAAAENDTSVAWRSVIEQSAAEHTRDMGIQALTAAAMRLATWQGILGVIPSTTAFPGQP